ncbi:MAG: carbohydrate-binding domain-containing protein [Candidatus Azotimanducaceae bacterium]
MIRDSQGPAIKFWWPAIMGSEVARAPEIATDANFSDQLTIFEEQNKFISELGESFRQGIRGGAPFNAKDLFTEMILSPWFTAKKNDPEKIQTASSTAGNIGNRRLLTPEELEAKTLSLLGSKWGSNGKEDLWQYDLEYTALGDRYGLYYGGIDSNGIRNRARAMSSLMINVAERQALEMACPAVIMDFSRADADRLLFENIEPMIEPDSESVQSYQVSAESFETSETFKHYLSVSPGKKEISISFLNDFNGGEDADRNLSITRIQISDSDGKMLLDADFSQYNQNNLIDGIGLGELNCGDYSFWEDSFKFWSNCSIEIPLKRLCLATCKSP